MMSGLEVAMAHVAGPVAKKVMCGVRQHANMLDKNKQFNQEHLKTTQHLNNSFVW